MKVVQIGSNKGNDHLSDYLKSNYTQLNFGLFVEPNTFHIQDLANCYSNYSNAIIENIAVKSPLRTETELEIFYNTNDGPGYEIASCNIDHIKKHMDWIPYLNEGEIKSFKIPCLTLEELFDKHQISYLDWFLLDVEGIDAEILLTFNWSKYKIKKIEFENLHLGHYSYNIESMLIGMGYQRTTSLNEYDWAFVNNTIKETNKMKWETDLIEDIRTFTSFDDEDGGVPHPLGYDKPFNNNMGHIEYGKEVTHCNRYH